MKNAMKPNQSIPWSASIAIRTLFLLAGVLPVFSNINAQSVHQSLRKGDRQYLLDNFKNAEKEYRTAADLELANPKALYNLGNALYQQGKWKDAADRFDRAAQYSENKTDLANSLHNFGNALMKQDNFKDAVDAYENSLRLRPADEDTKRNLQMAKKKLKQQQQEQQQKQQEQQQQQQEQQEQQQNEQNQSQQPQDQPKQPNQPQQDQSGQPNDPAEQPQQPQPGKMKKEEAQRILETAVEPDDQKNAKKYRSAQRQNKPKTSKQDW